MGNDLRKFGREVRSERQSQADFALAEKISKNNHLQKAIKKSVLVDFMINDGDPSSQGGGTAAAQDPNSK